MKLVKKVTVGKSVNSEYIAEQQANAVHQEGSIVMRFMAPYRSRTAYHIYFHPNEIHGLIQDLVHALDAAHDFHYGITPDDYL